MKLRAFASPDEVDVDEYQRRVSAALEEVGCVHYLTPNHHIRYRPVDEPVVRKAQMLALDSMGIAYEVES